MDKDEITLDDLKHAFRYKNAMQTYRFVECCDACAHIIGEDKNWSYSRAECEIVGTCDWTGWCSEFRLREGRRVG